MIKWAAGLFEGEGCLDYSNGLRARVGMTDEDVIRKFHDAVGFGSVGTLQPPGNRKKVWVWSAYGENAITLMHIFYPYLGQRRLAIADKLIAKYAEQPLPARGGDPKWRKRRKVWRA